MPVELTTTVTGPTLSTRAKLFRGLGDPSRLTILEALREGRRNVGGIVGQTGLSQSNVSNHLACLLDCGLVTREQDGRFVYYALSDARVAELLETVEGLLKDVARGVHACRRYEVDAPG